METGVVLTQRHSPDMALTVQTSILIHQEQSEDHRSTYPPSSANTEANSIQRTNTEANSIQRTNTVTT